MQELKRLTIFSFYDEQGIVDRYVLYNLNHLREISDELVVISNGDLTEDSIEKIDKVSDRLIIRPNLGYDAGAYKDFFCTYSNENYLKDYDAVILANDTVYGPFYSYGKLFLKMDKVKCDCWGLSEINDEVNGSRIQSYFMVIRKKILSDAGFSDYWKRMDYPQNYLEDIDYFENGFSRWVHQRGFVRKCLVDESVVTKLGIDSRNPYLTHPLDIIQKADFPFYRRKNIGEICSDDYGKVKAYLRDKTDYDVSMIDENYLRLVRTGRMVDGRKRLAEFCRQLTKVYIYGKGKVGRLIERNLVTEHFFNYEFVVTKNDSEDNTIEFSNLELKEEEGIIIGVGRILTSEIYEIVANKVDENKIFCIHKEL